MSLGLVIQGPRGQGSTGERHRAEPREYRSGVPGSGVSVATRKASANTGIKEYSECWEREFRRGIYIDDLASHRSASLSYYDHRQYSIISLSLHPALLPYCLIAVLLAPDLL